MPKLILYDRQKLQYYLRTKLSLRKLAVAMRKDHTVLSREIRRNSGNRSKYRADTAQEISDKRRHQKRRGKLVKHPKLKEFVVNNLKSEWSPEEIAGRLCEVSRLEVDGFTLSHESTYRYIYVTSEKYGKLFKLLPQRRAKRRKRGGRKAWNMPIPQRISIKLRPEIVSKRMRIGDGKSDNLEFKRKLTIRSYFGVM